MIVAFKNKVSPHINFPTQEEPQAVRTVEVRRPRRRVPRSRSSSSAAASTINNEAVSAAGSTANMAVLDNNNSPPPSSHGAQAPMAHPEEHIASTSRNPPPHAEAAIDADKVKALEALFSVHVPGPVVGYDVATDDGLSEAEKNKLIDALTGESKEPPIFFVPQINASVSTKTAAAAAGEEEHTPIFKFARSTPVPSNRPLALTPDKLRAITMERKLEATEREKQALRQLADDQGKEVLELRELLRLERLRNRNTEYFSDEEYGEAEDEAFVHV